MLSIEQVEPHVLRRKTLEYLVSQMPSILLFANVSALIMAMVLYQRVPDMILLSWLTSLWLVSAFRWFQARNFRRLLQPDIPTHYPRFLFSTALAALIWGTGIMLFLPYLSPIHQSFLLFILAMLATQASVKMPKRLFFIFLFGIGVPSATWLLLSSNTLSFELGIIYSIGILMLYITAHQFNQKLFETICSGVENKHLLKEMMTFSQALKQLNDGVLVMDAEGKVQYANPAYCQQMDIKNDDIIEKTSPFFINDALTQEYGSIFWKAIAEGHSWSSRLLLGDSKPTPYLVTISPVYDIYHEITHLVSVQKSLAEHDKLEAQLAHAKKLEAIGTMTSGVAHDFNNILSNINCAMYFVHKHTDNHKDTEKYCQRIEDSVNKGADMISQLMSFARKDKVELKTIDLHAFLQVNLDEHLPTLPKAVHAEIDLHDSDVSITADEVKLCQVINNLLNNAADAMEAKDAEKNIQLCVESHVSLPENLQTPEIHGPFVHISIQDSGSGMGKDVLEHIFEPFFTTKGAGKGTGLGLAMAYGTIQSHHGFLTVDSELGVGTCFHIYLPL